MKKVELSSEQIELLKWILCDKIDELSGEGYSDKIREIIVKLNK